jgi:AraC family transcriptional regulator
LPTRPPEATPANVPIYAPGEIWLDTTEQRTEPVSVRGIRFQPSHIRAPGLSAHLLVLYRSGQTLMTRRLTGRAVSEVIRPGDVSLMSSGLASDWAWPGRIEVLHLYVDRATLQEVAGTVCDRTVEDIALRDILKLNDDLLTRMGQLLVDEATTGGLGSRLLVDAITQQMCVHLLRNYAELSIRTPAASGTFSKLKMRKLEEYIKEHVAEDLSLATLAEVTGVSPSYFSRLFRNSFGIPPHHYLLKHRLASARDLLRGKRHSIAEIAAMTGFSDQAHLTRFFKRQFALTPDQFRKA